MATLVQQLDGTIDRLLSGWNVWSYLLTAVILVSLLSPLFLTSEPDTHPLLLARQAATSSVRQPGESATYRSLEAPHGYPLRSGLDVRDPGTPKWTAGRDGDLRDIWKEAVHANKGKIYSLKGRNEPIEHKLEDLSKEINVIGKHLEAQQATRVAIYLPNSVELVTTLFTAAFYGFTPILITLRHSPEHLFATLREIKADALVTAAGVLTPEQLEHANLKLKKVIWVVEHSSRELDFKHDSHASEWHSLVEQAQSPSTELPTKELEGGGPNIICATENEDSREPTVVEYTQKNLIAAIAAQINALPRTRRFSDSDLVLSLESLTSTFALSVTLAAFYSHASIALTTVAGDKADYDLAFQRIKPTVVIASSKTLSEAHTRKDAASQGLLQKIQRYRSAQALASGAMGAINLNNGIGPRLLYTSGRADGSTQPLAPQEIANLRILTGARIVHALTSPQVAGSIAQTNALDYRVDNGSKRQHFGAPISSVEVKLVGNKSVKIADDQEDNHVGEIFVTGPAVVGGKVNVGVLGKFGSDHTLRLA